MSHRFAAELRKLEAHYSQLFREHGDSAAAAQWSSLESQERRMSILADCLERTDASVLDFGCGAGRMLEYLRRERGFTGAYTGVDLCSEALEAAARKYPEAKLICRDILAEPLTEHFDYIFISGVFNNLIQDNAGFMRQVLLSLYPLARRILAFNALSTYVDYFSDGLYYADPGEVFAFCKERLSPLITLRHDYLVKEGAPPFEFTVYVHACTAAPVARKEARV